MKTPILILGFLFCLRVAAQRNCEYYRYMGDTLKYMACKKTDDADKHYQFSKEYQEIMDASLAIDSTFDLPYRAKSVAYLKSGDFLTWKKLIDKAVFYNVEENLGYRGWCRYQFFRDYQGAIEDIERLDKLTGDVGFSANGDYHLNIAKALCYKAIGQPERAIEILEDQLASDGHSPGKYDYYHLGVLYCEKQDFARAIEALTKQTTVNNLAEVHYYLGLTLNAFRQDGISEFELARTMYLSGQIMMDPYTHPMDKIFLIDIENELKNQRGLK